MSRSNFGWLLVFALVLGLGCFRQAGPGAAPTKVWEREELRTAVINKAPDDVLKAIGKPKSTTDDGPSQMWTYEDIARDPITGETEGLVFLHFRKGVVDSVNFSN